MNRISRLKVLVALTWLCVGLVIGVTADVVEDLVFDIPDVPSADGTTQAGEGDDAAIPATRLASLPLQELAAASLLLPIALSMDGLAYASPPGLILPAHGPPAFDPHSTPHFNLPLRI